MATILKGDQREFREDPNKIDHYRLLSDVSRKQKGVNPKNINSDLRQLNPGQCEYPDSGKILLAPSFEIFSTESKTAYFDGEKDIQGKWKQMNDESS